ncbi:MAG: hypothetical protein MUO64_13580 [Anaerolineales bacterium]|nr:hypothetical protein [Anaerolineales bacterium]
MVDKLIIKFITSNKGKVLSMRKWVEPLGIKVYKHRKKISFREMKLPSVEDVAIQKALDVSLQIKNPFVVQDSGFFLEALPGFPGPDVNHVLSTVGINGILKMVPKNRRSCYFKDVLAFWSPSLVEIRPYEVRIIKENGYIKYISTAFKEETLASNIILFVSQVFGTVAKKPSEVKNSGAWSELWKIFIPLGFSSTLASMDSVERFRFSQEVRLKPEFNCFLAFANWIKSNINHLYVQSSFIEDLYKDPVKNQRN